VGQKAPDDNSVNIGLQDSKDFPADIAPIQELYSELCTSEGGMLFECPGLLKPTGIDLMNCPLDVVLKLRVRRRLPTGQGAMVLWHTLLPLNVIARYLMEPPHEWETWLGLLPNTQALEMYPPETIFTQCVHLISRADFPKLRIRFSYHNPELMAQTAMRRQNEQAVYQRRQKVSESFGQQAFQDIGTLLQPRRNHTRLTSSASSDVRSDAPAKAPSSVPPAEEKRLDEAKLQEALAQALTVISDSASMIGMGGAGLSVEEVLASSNPTSLIDTYGHQVQQMVSTRLATVTASGEMERSADERNLAEGLRYALMGMMDESEAPRIPRTSTGLSSQSTEQLSQVRARYPALWEVYREVSKLALERVSLMDQLGGIRQESSQSPSAQAELEFLRQQLSDAQQLIRIQQDELQQLRLAAQAPRSPARGSLGEQM